MKRYTEEIDDIICDGLELEEMGKIASTIAPSNVEEKIYEEIIKILKQKLRKYDGKKIILNFT